MIPVHALHPGVHAVNVGTGVNARVVHDTNPVVANPPAQDILRAERRVGDPVQLLVHRELPGMNDEEKIANASLKETAGVATVKIRIPLHVAARSVNKVADMAAMAANAAMAVKAAIAAKVAIAAMVANEATGLVCHLTLIVNVRPVGTIRSVADYITHATHLAFRQSMTAR